MTYTVKVIVIPAELSTGASATGEVCPNEWVYHYIDTAASGHHGAGKHLKFDITKAAEEGASVAVTRHLAPPLKLVPPYVSLDYSQSSVTSTIEMCDVEEGKQYLGLLGQSSAGGCMNYQVTATKFTGSCEEFIHAPSDDPAAIADLTLPIEHFERASCDPYQWFDMYLNVTDEMVSKQVRVTQ